MSWFVWLVKGTEKQKREVVSCKYSNAHKNVVCAINGLRITKLSPPWNHQLATPEESSNIKTAWELIARFSRFSSLSPCHPQTLNSKSIVKRRSWFESGRETSRESWHEKFELCKKSIKRNNFNNSIVLNESKVDETKSECRSRSVFILTAHQSSTRSRTISHSKSRLRSVSLKGFYSSLIEIY